MEKRRYFILLHLLFAFYSMLSIVSKIASGKPLFSVDFCALYGVVLLGMFVYAILWQQILKKLPIVTAYSNKAVTVAWGIVWGYIFFDEPITIRKVFGAMVIIVGVYLIVSSEKEMNIC